MRLVIALYRRVNLLQEGRWFRIAATVLAVLGCGLVFGSLLQATYSLEAQRAALRSALHDQNYSDRDEHAVSLHDTGTVTVGGRTYGGQFFKDRADLIFNEKGDLVAPDPLINALLSDQRPAWAPRWLVEHPETTWLLGAAAIGWLLLIIWLGITVPFVLTLVGTAIPVVILWWSGSETGWRAVAGMGLLTFTFILLSRAVQALLNRPFRPLAVAHTVLKEASRLRISLVFIIGLLILLPLIPVSLDSHAPLRFQVQTFISRSLGFTYLLAACFTLLMSCATVAFEIRDRQIWQLVTKPIHRFQYLLGKWVGVTLINLVLLSVAGVSTFTFIQYLREQPVERSRAGMEDRQQLADAVLTARVGMQPVYEELSSGQIRSRVDQAIQNDPDLAHLDEVPPAKRRQIAADIQQAHLNGLRSIPPAGAGRSYRFTGLEEAKSLQSSLTLRYRFHILRDDEHLTYRAVFRFNGDQGTDQVRTYVPTMSHVLPISTDLIQDDGTIELTIFNIYQPQPDERGYGSLNFEADDLELLYQVSTFESNFLRAMLIMWIKLAFLSMLGIACSTLLSFPVACLMSFTLFIAASTGPFLSTSLEQYYPPDTAAMDWTNIGLVIQWAFRSVIRFVAQSLVFLLSPFGDFRSTRMLVEGRFIPWSGVAKTGVLIGVVWSGAALVIGYLVIRVRQLAIYSGHG